MESSTITIPSSIPDQLTVDDEVISVPIHDGSEDDSNTQLETSDQITLHENDDNLVGSSVVDTAGLDGCSVVDTSGLSEGAVIDVASLTNGGVRNAVVDVSSLGNVIDASALTGATVLNTGALSENAVTVTSLTNQNAQSLDVSQSTVTSIEHIQNVMSFGDVSVDAQSSIVDISHIVQQMNSSVAPPSIITGEGSQTVQAVTLSDGTTAFIQHPKGGKFLEGQTITLEDGTTAVVQVTNLSVQPSAITSDTDTILSESTPVLDNTVSGDQTVQLEDGTTAFIQNTGKDGVHALQLEDGTTAYITHPSAISLFGDNTMDSTAINLDQFTSQGDVIKQENSLQALQQAKGQIIPGHITVITAGIAPEKTISEKFVNSIGERAFRCNFDGCGRLFTTQHHLKVHERSHTGDRPFKCETSGCGKAFATGYGLKSHTRVHTGEKPYKCTEKDCEKAFKTSGDLQKHVRTHTGERPFKCPFEGCDRSFTTSNIRKVHIRTHTGERPYVCTEEGCGRAFASATNYKNHIRIHTGEKPYVCTSPGCGKKFTEYSSLYKHHVVHTLSKPYVCNRCGKTYRQTSTLAMHKRTAHGEDVTAESEAELYQQQLAAENGTSGEPLAKKPKFEYALNVTEADGGDQGAMIIANQTDLTNGESQQSGLPTGEDDATNILQNAIPTSITLDQLQQQGGVTAISVLENGQQIFVITDPSRLEALQQLTQQSTQTTVDGTNSQDIIAVNSADLNTNEQPLNIENTMTVAGGIEFKDD